MPELEQTEDDLTPIEILMMLDFIDKNKSVGCADIKAYFENAFKRPVAIMRIKRLVARMRAPSQIIMRL